MLYDDVYFMGDLFQVLLRTNPDIVDHMANDALSHHDALTGAADTPLSSQPWVGLNTQRSVTEPIWTDRSTLWDPTDDQSLFEGEDPALLILFWEAMHEFSRFTARIFAAAVDFTPFRRLLDVGGGSAAYAIELCRRYAHLHVTVYDLPFVVTLAADKVVRAGLADRIQTVGGDVFADEPLPVGHDVILLSKILRDWDEATSRACLRQCYQALPSGGAVIIEDMLINDGQTAPTSAAPMHRHMLMEREGRTYMPAEYSAWLTDLGFRVPQPVWFDAPDTNGAVLGYKP